MKHFRRTATRVVVAVAAVLASSGAAVVSLPAGPAAAACPSIVDAKWYQGWSMTMRQDGITCTERWGRLTIDYFPYYGYGLSVRIERQIASPYGWYETHKYWVVQGAGASAGFWSTPRTPNTGSEDRHRICSAYSKYVDGRWVPWVPAGSTTDCNDWVY